MATTKNAGSLFLSAANPRLLNAANAAVILTASAPIFHVATNGTPDTTTIFLSAQLIALEGTVTFSATGATLPSISGNSASLLYSNMTANVATITATLVYRGSTFTSTVNISKLFDPSVTSGLNNAVVYAYKRSGTAPTDNPGAITYDFTIPGITTTTLANSWAKTIPSGTSPLYVVAASASNVGSTDNIAAGEWSTPVALAQNGVDGLSVATVFIYKRTATNVAPSLPTASTTYTFTTGVLTGLDGGWTTSVPAASGGAYLWISTATAAATTATDTLLASEWATPNLMAQDGIAGGNNAIVYAYQRSTTAPTLTPGAVTYDFTTASITTATLLNGWLKAIPAGTDPLYVTTASASNSASTDNIGSGEWSGAVKLAQNGNNGLDGLSVATVFIYKRTSANSAPALPTVSTTFTFATGVLTGLDNGWSTTVPAASGNPYLWVSTATASNTTATDTLAASEWAAVQLMAQDGVATSGTRGAGHYYAVGSSWTDAAADAATPGANIVDDVVTIANGTNFVSEKKWTGTAWANNGVVIDGSLIVPDSVTASKINSNGLTIRKPDGTVIVNAGGLQPGFEAPGTKNADAAFSPKLAWEFRNSLEGWTVSGADTITHADTFGCTSGTADPQFVSPSVSLDGSLYDKIRARVRRLSAGGTWQGQVYYATGSHGYSESHTAVIPDTTILNTWVVLEWDMSSLSAGGTDWVVNVINSFRIDLVSSAGVSFEIDSVFVGKYGPTNIRDLGMSGDLDATKGAPAGTLVGSTDAATVEANANNAIARYNSIAADNILSRNEKPMVIADFIAIGNEIGLLQTQANNLGVSHTALTGAYNSLNSYITTMSPAYDDTSVDTPIADSTFRAQFINYYTAKANLQNAMLTKVNTTANAAYNGLADKLNKGANDVLGGILSVNTVSAPAGFRAGTIDWNAAGYRTSGYGIAMTPLGLVGYNTAGNPTFFVDATNGNATFWGTLSAATGSFAGSLMAVTGSFGNVTVDGSVSSGQTAYDTGNGFWIQGGATPKMSMKTASGKSFLCDPANNVLSFNGGAIDGVATSTIVTGAAAGATADTKLANPPHANNPSDISVTIYTVNGSVGSRTASITGGTAPFTYLWTLENTGLDNGPGYGIEINSGKTSATVGLYAYSTGAAESYNATLRCDFRDASGLTGSCSFNALATFP